MKSITGKWLIILIVILTPALCGCLEVDHNIPGISCTLDNVMYDTETGEIIDDPNTGAAMSCEGK